MTTKIPFFPSPALKQIDQWMMEDYKITITQMMEIAGFNQAIFTKQYLYNSVKGKRIIIACGKGHNGGDGLVAARYLANWGAIVSIILTDEPSQLAPVTLEQLERIQKLPVVLISPTPEKMDFFLKQADVLIDAMLGFGLSGDPKENIAKIILEYNASRKPILALDIPSGLDATNGTIYSPCIKASATMTLGFPKTGFQDEKAKKMLGELYLADIGIPPKLIKEKFGYNTESIFAESTIVKVKLSYY